MHNKATVMALVGNEITSGNSMSRPSNGALNIQPQSHAGLRIHFMAAL